MRALAMTGIDTASWISPILEGSAMRATPPSLRMSAGTRSSAMTAAASASSAVTTSMITPPLSISARPALTRKVPVSFIATMVSAALGGLVAGARARVGHPPGGCGHQAPVVAPLAQGELRHAERRVVAILAVRRHADEGVAAAAAYPDDQLADAANRVVDALGRLRPEALVEVLVPRQHQVDIARVGAVPGGRHIAVVVVAAGGEARPVPARERAGGRVRRQVLLEPAHLGRLGAAATHLPALGVQRHHVPAAHVEAVVALVAVGRLAGH